MKRKLFLFLATMLICSSMTAQVVGNYYQFTQNDYQYGKSVIAQININGEEQTSNQIELGAFNGNDITGSGNIGQYGSSNYSRVYITIKYNTSYVASFKIYDHATGMEYENFEVTYNGEPYNIELTNEDGIGSRKTPVVINFITYNKDITAYSSTNNGWYLIASPIGQVAPDQVINMTGNTYDLYRFNQSAAPLEWENNSNHNFNLEPGKGYLYANSANVTLMFNGMPYSESGEVTLDYDANTTWKGVNLIGNPYPTDATLDRPFYRLNYNGTFEALTENEVIAAMEGVIVRVDEAGTANFTATTKRGTSVIPQTNIVVTSNRGRMDDKAIIRFDGGATLGKYQLFEGNAQVFIPQNGREYAVVDAGTQGELPLNFKATKNGSYTLSFNTENMTMEYFHLIDNLTGNDIDLLATPSYSFEARTDDYVSRFRLVFTTSNNDENQIAFISNGEIILNGVNGYTTVQLIDVNGRILSSTNGANRISTENMANGVYMIRLINGSDVKTQKIVVK